MARHRRQRFVGQHVLITGGSEGIGLAIARHFVAEGASVTLVARTPTKLEAAAQQLAELGGAGRVRYEAADISVPAEIQAAVASAEAAQGPVDVLVANAGSAQPGYFHDAPYEAFERAMRVNYLGCVSTIKTVYSSMVARNAGHIAIVASAMALMAFTGYATYCPTKCAIKGLADTLRNELQGTSVRVSIAFPPDVDTPGFKRENDTKPPECREISDAIGSVFSADVVAKGIVSGIAAKRYILNGPDIGLNLQATLMQGLGWRGVLDTLVLSLVGLFLPTVQAAYALIIDRIARRSATARFAALTTPLEATEAASKGAAAEPPRTRKSS